MTTVLYYVSISLATIWMMLTVYIFAVLLHESLTLKDPKAFVHSWTDFLGITIYLLMAMLASVITIIEFIISPKKTIAELRT